MKRPQGHTRRALLVLGMHRSGTSAATRVASLLGAELGSDLVPPGPDNPDGFWEHAEAVRVNDELLRGLGRTWYDMREMPDGWIDSPHARSAAQRIDTLIERDFARSGLCAVKDPRMCLTAPLWTEAFERRGFQVDCLFVVRDPEEVVESLHRRNDWQRAPLYLMWVQYLMEATAATAGRRRAMITYEQLLSDWRDSMARVARELQLCWPGTLEDATVRAIDAFLQPAHRHHRGSPHAANGDATDMPDIAARLYQACLGIASGESGWSELSDQHDSFRETARLFAAHVEHLHDTRWRAEGRARSAEARLSELTPVTAAVHDAMLALQEKLDGSILRLQNEMTASFCETAARFERHRESLMAVEARIQRQHALLNTMSLQLEQAAGDQAAGRVEAAVAPLRDELQNVRSALADSNAAVAALTASTSWRLTAPVRWLGVHLLRRPPPLDVPALAEPAPPKPRSEAASDAPPVHSEASDVDATTGSVAAAARKRPDQRDRHSESTAFRHTQGVAPAPLADG